MHLFYLTLATVYANLVRNRAKALFALRIHAGLRALSGCSIPPASTITFRIIWRIPFQASHYYVRQSRYEATGAQRPGPSRLPRYLEIIHKYQLASFTEYVMNQCHGLKYPSRRFGYGKTTTVMGGIGCFLDACGTSSASAGEGQGEDLYT